MHGAGRYEIRVKGKLNASLRSAFDDMAATVEPVETILAGTMEDQAALYSVLQRVAPAADAELAIDRFQVRLHGVHREVHLGRDLPIRHHRREMPEHGEL